ncbi:uncharacterized protein [Aristolochia californica]|uniref:uncharacterized protein n=1 Tax=Aristolochia californica TaxID=171875 RepID=UPI0035DE6A9D
MSPDIMKRYIRLRTAREIWNALEKTFYDGSDESQLFSLNQRVFSTKQTGRPLSMYYGDLVEKFQELDHRDRTIMKDPDDVIAYRKSIERLRVHIFLNGLDAEFEQVRGEILRKDPILDLEEVYAYVCRDSARRTTLNSEVDRVETSAMVARRAKPKTARPTGPNSYQNRTSGSQNQWWDPTKAPRKRNSKSNNHASVVVEEPSTSHTTEDASVLIATSGKVLNTSTPSGNSKWIIDSGVTDHMTFDNHHVKSMKPSEQHIVSKENGTPSHLIGECSITLTENLSLDSQNGVAERKNRHLLEVVRASLFEAHMSASYWGEAITTAAYLINRIPSSVLQFQTPLSVLHKTISAPAVPNLPPKVFGCVAFVHLHKSLRHKLEPRALKCVFVGYAQHQKGYRCYHPPSRKLYVTLDVVFHEENMYYSTPESSIQGENRIELKNLYHHLDILDTTSGQYSDYSCGHQNDTNQHDSQDGERQDQMEVMQPESQPPFSSLHNVPMDQLPSESESMSEPQEALKDPKWKEAMNEEMGSLQKNSTWEVVDLPVGKTPVECRCLKLLMLYRKQRDAQAEEILQVEKPIGEAYSAIDKFFWHLKQHQVSSSYRDHFCLS